MKKTITIAVALLVSLAGINAYAANDLKNVLGAVSKAAGSSSDSNPLGTIGNLISNFTASSNFDVTDLVGTWKYDSPAVTFKSDNALQKVGGAAAASSIENKIEPYYNKVGVNSMVLTIDKDLNFTMQLKRGTLKGTVSKDNDGNLEFAFNAFGKVSLGKMSAYATKSGNTLNLTFDVSKLVKVLKTVSSVAQVSTLTTLSKLLESYDGIFVGFKMKSQN